jgi:hypothetical protein
MALLKCTVSVDDIRDHVAINVDQDGKMLCQLLMDAPAVADFISELANQRAALKEQVAPMLDPGSRIDALIEPSFRIEGELWNGRRILAFRHPGFGWLGFALDQKHADEIAYWLTHPASIAS